MNALGHFLGLDDPSGDGDPLGGVHSAYGDTPCAADGCDKPVKAQGWCSMHYTRVRKHGDPTVGPKTWAGVVCSVDGCEKPVKTLGWCTAHHTRWRRHGDPAAKVRPYGPKGARTCAEADCSAPVMAIDLCQRHYNLHHKQRKEAAAPCAVDGCHRPRRTRDWCTSHYQRWLKYGNPTAGGPQRRDRGTGYPQEWYSEQRRRKIGFPSRETLEYVEILRRDPCSYCGAPWEHTDHIRPVSNGGAGDWTNLTAACASCNYRKSNTELLPFLLKRLEAA